MDREKQLNLQEFFAQESEKNGWQQESEPEKMLLGAREAMENTRVLAASSCFGNQPRIDASNAMFQVAKAGVEQTLQTVESMQLTAPQTAGGSDESKPDWVQAALLLGAFLCCAFAFTAKLGILRSLLTILAAVMAGTALVREAGRLIRLLDLSGAVKLFAKTIRWKKLRTWLEKQADGLRKKQQPAAALPPQVRLDADAVGNACLAQMQLIGENLPLFNEVEQNVIQPGGEELWPLVRTMVQRKYSEKAVYPEIVEDELNTFLAENKIQLVDYSPENAHFFTTQTMDETFTIFPAILRDGRMMEHGRAGVAAKEG